jgi:hypothetical protein
LTERGVDKIQHGVGISITETLKEQDKNVTIKSATRRHSLKENPSPLSHLYIHLDRETMYKLVKGEDTGA